MEIGLSEQSLPESGVLRVRVTEDFELDGGAWKPAGEQKGWDKRSERPKVGSRLAAWPG